MDLRPWLPLRIGPIRVPLPGTLPAATAQEFSCQIDYAGDRQYVTFCLDAGGNLAQIHFSRYFYTDYTADTLTRQSGVLDVLDTDAQTIAKTIANTAAQSSALPPGGNSGAFPGGTVSY